MFKRQRQQDVFARRMPVRRKRPVLRALVMIIVAGVISLLATLAFFGVRPPYLFFPDKVISYWPHDLRPPLAYERVTFTTLDEVEISAWWVPARTDDAPTIVFFHGPVGDLGDQLGWIRLAQNSGFHVLAVDYRGFGGSGGVPSVGGVYRDADAAYRWVTEEKGVPPEELIIFGRSLGAAVAAHLAERRPAQLVVLESAYPSVKAVGGKLVARETGRELPALVVRMMYWNADLNTIHRVSEIDAPILIMHSPDDEFMPFDYAENIAAAAGDNASITELRGPHNSVIDATGETYFVPVRAAFEASRRGL